jgi:hypothetical protein
LVVHACIGAGGGAGRSTSRRPRSIIRASCDADHGRIERLAGRGPQFGTPSSVFVGKDDTIYVGSSFPDPAAKKSELRGIMIGSVKDGSLKAYIPDPGDLDNVDVGTSASEIAADDAGTIYVADVGTHGLRKYLKVR